MELLLIIGIFIIGLLILFKLQSLSSNKADSEAIESMKTYMDTKLFQHTTSLDQKLSHASTTFGHLNKNIGEILESNQKMFELGKKMTSLHDLFRTPKLRGNFGETLLGEILQTYLPNDKFVMEYSFPGGQRVDACIFLHDQYKLCIDSKFPLENFQKSLDDNHDTKQAIQVFKRDLKKHIDTISEKYIQQSEKTLDFALMYIPSEQIYYEVFVTAPYSDVQNYAYSKNVMPISPQTFYTYLQTIIMGFNGMKVEEHAAKILRSLDHLRGTINQFDLEYQKMGKHLHNAQGAYTESQRKFDKVKMSSDILENLETSISPENHSISIEEELVSELSKEQSLSR